MRSREPIKLPCAFDNRVTRVVKFIIRLHLLNDVIFITFCHTDNPIARQQLELLAAITTKIISVSM